MSLIEDLTALHEHYVERVNLALETNNEALARELAQTYDRETLDLVRR